MENKDDQKSVLSILSNVNPADLTEVTVLIQALLAASESELAALTLVSTNANTAYSDAAGVYDAAVLVTATLEGEKTGMETALAAKAAELTQHLVNVATDLTAKTEAHGAKTIAQSTLDAGGVALKNEITTIKQVLALLSGLTSTDQSGEYHLFFKQTMPTVKDKAGWLNTGVIKDPNYSRLNLLDDTWKGADGKFQFKMVWPLVSGGQFNEWKQSSNPVKFHGQPGYETAINVHVGSGVDGYEAVSIYSDSQGWGGLEYNPGPDSLLDGSVDNYGWWYAVGTAVVPGYGGFPGPGVVTTVVELYVLKP